jgi:enamine deaminase RidA (YjgF/YER057c/UK114 family)
MTIQLINPADLPPQATYTQVVVAAGTALVFIAGQEPEDVHATRSPLATWRARPARSTRIWAAR